MYELNNDWLKTRTYYSFFLQINNFTLKKFVMKKFKTIFADEVSHIWNPNIELKASQNNYISCLTENETNYL